MKGKNKPTLGDLSTVELIADLEIVLAHLRLRLLRINRAPFDTPYASHGLIAVEALQELIDCVPLTKALIPAQDQQREWRKQMLRDTAEGKRYRMNNGKGNANEG